MDSLLSINRLSVALQAGADRPFALEDVSIEVKRGELVCLVGESGSGKSMTARAIMGLLPPKASAVAGYIRYGREDILRLSNARLRELRGAKISMLFQEPMSALNPVMTVGDQIGEALTIHSRTPARERRSRVLEMIRAVRLPDPERIIDAYPHQLSGGQRQRVVIATGLMLDPELIIADEPTTALDVTTQSQILALIQEIRQRRGTGVLFITHDFGVVAEIADRVIVMKHGRVVEAGSRTAILTKPTTDYTRALIASVPGFDPPERQARGGESILTVERLVKTYNDAGRWKKNARKVHALGGVDLHVRRSETVGVVGESGSGKSTLARCIMRLLDPTAGSIKIGGIDIATLQGAELKACRRSVQMVFQDPFRSLNPRRKVALSIMEGPMNFGSSKAEAYDEARKLVQLVGLSPAALDRYPHEFSGGQRQRIAIARALAMKPKLLIADEAISALDVSVQAQIIQLFEDIRERFDLAMLFITHDLRVAAQICDRIAVMKAGVIVEQGPTAAVFGTPSHAYTRELLASTPGRSFSFWKMTS